MTARLAYINRDPYLNHPLLKAIERGFEVIKADSSGVLVADSDHSFALLSADQPEQFLPLIEKPALMVVIGHTAAERVRQHFHFENQLVSLQYYYPHPDIASDFQLEPAALADLTAIAQIYKLASEEELRKSIEMGWLWVARDEGKIIGFIGRHSDGSLGMMEVLPNYRRQGWGERMERALIKLVLAEGDLPYGHVVIGNEASRLLQEKLGLVCCKDEVVWFW